MLASRFNGTLKGAPVAKAFQCVCTKARCHSMTRWEECVSYGRYHATLRPSAHTPAQTLGYHPGGPKARAPLTPKCKGTDPLGQRTRRQQHNVTQTTTHSYVHGTLSSTLGRSRSLSPAHLPAPPRAQPPGAPAHVSAPSASNFKRFAPRPRKRSGRFQLVCSQRLSPAKTDEDPVKTTTQSPPCARRALEHLDD